MQHNDVQVTLYARYALSKTMRQLGIIVRDYKSPEINPEQVIEDNNFVRTLLQACRFWRTRIPLLQVLQHASL